MNMRLKQGINIACDILSLKINVGNQLAFMGRSSDAALLLRVHKEMMYLVPLCKLSCQVFCDFEYSVRSGIKVLDNLALHCAALLTIHDRLRLVHLASEFHAIKGDETK